MPVKFEFNSLDKGPWVLLRQVYTLLSRCQDQVYGEHDLTTEQHTLLMAVKHIGAPVRITDIARWLDRTPNGPHGQGWSREKGERQEGPQDSVCQHDPEGREGIHAGNGGRLVTHPGPSVAAIERG